MTPASTKTAALAGRCTRAFASRPRPSPTVRKGKAKTPAPRQSTAVEIEPLLLLASRDGQIPVAPPAASAFLEEFELLRGKSQLTITNINNILQSEDPSNSHVRILTLIEHGIRGRALFQFANVLSRQAHEPSAQSLTRALYRAGADLHDEYAALALVDQAIRIKQPNHSDVQTALKVLSQLASEGSIDAAERLAAICELRGDKAQALSYAEKVLSTLNSSIQQEKDQDAPTPPVRAWRIASRLRKASGDLEGYEAATEAGANHYKDPAAYRELATIVAPRSAELELRYLLTAAASGSGTASYALGDIFLRVGRNDSDVTKYRTAMEKVLGIRGSIEATHSMVLSLAAEWFRIALEAASKDNAAAQESAAKGAVAAMQAMGDTRGCQALLADHIHSAWAKEMALSDGSDRDPRSMRLESGLVRP